MWPMRSSRARKSSRSRKRSVRSPNSPAAITSAVSTGEPARVGEQQRFAHRHLAPGTHKRCPGFGLGVRSPPGQEHLDASAWLYRPGLRAQPRTRGVKTRRQHTRVVQDQHVAGLEEGGQIGELLVERRRSYRGRAQASGSSHARPAASARSVLPAERNRSLTPASSLRSASCLEHGNSLIERCLRSCPGGDMRRPRDTDTRETASGSETGPSS